LNALLTTVIFVLTVIGQSANPLKASKNWSRDQAAHLLRRAGFGGTPREVDQLVRKGRAGAVDALLHFSSEVPTPPELNVRYFVPPRPAGRRAGPDLPPDEMTLRDLADFRRRDILQLLQVRDWWIRTMATSSSPLQEKLVLFWHGHFTSGHREVRSSYAMYQQNQLFRRMGAGNYRTFLIEISEDPAMVLYLNTQQNRRDSPNENYARELLELFTLGPGQYTEQDIKEAARAFTGITIDFETGQIVPRPRLHDFGEKTFLGRRGKFDSKDIIDIILSKPAAAEHIARKFWTFFASDDPPTQVVQALARVLRESRYEIAPMLRAMFMSDAFYGERSRLTHIKSPVELLAGTIRMLEIEPKDTTAMAFMLGRLGQELMQPPNVKGWDGGDTWITTSTMFNRYNFMCSLIEGTDDPMHRRDRQRRIRQMRENVGAEAVESEELAMRFQPALDPMPMIRTAKIRTPEKVVDYFLDRLLQRPVERNRRAVLLEAFKGDLRNDDVQDEANAAAIRLLIQLIVSMPEYQLS
jgi:uncharacterized protein (DUF1800 family)